MGNRIVFNPKILAGKPIIKGTRISVEFILELLSSGMSVQEIIKEYPHLRKEDILASIEYVAKTIKHEDLIFPVEPKKAKEDDRDILTHDKDFGNLLNYPLESHSGLQQ